MTIGLYMIDVVSSLRLSWCPDEQVLYRLHVGECIYSCCSQEKRSSFRAWTLNGNLSPDLQTVDSSVRSHQISSPGGILSREGGSTVLVVSARFYWQRKKYWSLNNGISQGVSIKPGCLLFDVKSFSTLTIGFLSAVNNSWLVRLQWTSILQASKSNKSLCQCIHIEIATNQSKL